MEPRKNIILIQGRDGIGVDSEVSKLVAAFRERQSDTNIEFFRFEEIKDFRSIEQKLLSVGLFAEKRLFIFRGEFEEKRKEKKSKVSEGASRASQFIRIIESVDDETFILIVPEKGMDEEIEGWMKKSASIRSFQSIFDKNIWAKRFESLEIGVIEEVIRSYEQILALYEEERKPENISQYIYETLEKLSLLSLSQRITKDIIQESLLLDGSGRIFDLIDALLAKNIKKSIHLFRTLVNESSVHGLLPSMIGLLRGSVYAKLLASKGYREQEIITILKIHPFVLKKALSAPISFHEIRDIYDEMISINIAYRSGKRLHDPELGRIFSIERAIMGLKK